MSSSIGVSESCIRTQTTLQCSIEVVGTLFSSSRHASQSGTETVSPKGLGIDASWGRKLYTYARRRCEGVDEHGDRGISSSEGSVWRGSLSSSGLPWFLHFHDNHREEARHVPFRQSWLSLKMQREGSTMVRNWVPFLSHSLCFRPPFSFVDLLSSMASALITLRSWTTQTLMR